MSAEINDDSLLSKINKVNDIKDISSEDYSNLASEIREFLIDSISETGGHLASNLGAVELTMALHLSLNLPEDKIIWDVGHQSYTHKLLTGRKNEFSTLRKYGGMSGFPKRKESDCDAFDTGHSSTSISAGLGLVKARELSGGNNTIVSVIGDGSLTGGMAYEAMNNASKLESNFIIVLNDNNMSISENVGGVSQYLNNIRTNEGYLDLKDSVYNRLIKTKAGENLAQRIRKAKSSFKQLIIPGMFFEDMGITYLGPVDGHDVAAMIKVIGEAKRCKSSVLVHVITEKGKGYEPAMRHPSRFHGTEPFNIETGLPKKMREKANYTDIFSTVMCKLGAKNDKLLAITAAMPDGTGLKRFHNMYPERFFDVGIAEEHAVTFAAGLAAGGYHPVFAVYSSFLQRAYDQIIHDVCLQRLPVIFAIDRAGIVGSDGETHQGIFDLSYLSSIPGLTIMAPKNKWDLADMLQFAADFEGPIAIRYPRGEAYDGLRDKRLPIEYGKAEAVFDDYEGSDCVCLVAIGSMVKSAVAVRDILMEKGIKTDICNVRFLKPIDADMLTSIGRRYGTVVTLEENVSSGGLGEKVLDLYNENKIDTQVIKICIPDEYVEHGNPAILLKELGLDAEDIAERIINLR